MNDPLDRFRVANVEDAKLIILTPEAGHDTTIRSDMETPATAQMLGKLARPQARVLDFGMGIGRVAKALVESRLDIEILGIEPVPEMRAQAVNYLGSTPRLAVFSSLDEVADESIDLAYAIYVLQHVEGNLLAGIVDTLFRKLRAEGILYILDFERRLVPSPTKVETSAADHPTGRFAAIRSVALRPPQQEEAWVSDDFSVVGVIQKRFKCEGHHVELDAEFFGPDTIQQHNSMVFTRRA